MITDCVKLDENSLSSPQCEYFVLRKKRLCRMTVRPGRRYCGEHEPQPPPCTPRGQADARVPCPFDPKHTCYASKLAKHLSICNSRQTESPPYIVHNINAPPAGAPCPRTPLSQVSHEALMQLINKVNMLYEKHVRGEIASAPELPVHAAVADEWAERGERARRHLRQASSLLHAAERAGLVHDRTCYVELGAGRGQLAYYAWRAWCAAADAGSDVLCVDRASPRHKRDNKAGGGAARLRADLAHLALERAPRVARSEAVVGLAKHLCGVATDYALRCVTAAGVVHKTRGLVLATCCHHRCERAAYLAAPQLQDLGLNGEDLNIMLGVVSWATCGDGRGRGERAGAGAGADLPGSGDLPGSEDPHCGASEARLHAQDDESKTNDQVEGGRPPLSAERRERAGRHAKALLDWGRVLYLREKGFDANLCYYVPATVSPENVCIIAKKIT